MRTVGPARCLQIRAGPCVPSMSPGRPQWAGREAPGLRRPSPPERIGPARSGFPFQRAEAPSSGSGAEPRGHFGRPKRAGPACLSYRPYVAASWRKKPSAHNSGPTEAPCGRRRGGSLSRARTTGTPQQPISRIYGPSPSSTIHPADHLGTAPTNPAIQPGDCQCSTARGARLSQAACASSATLSSRSRSASRVVPYVFTAWQFGHRAIICSGASRPPLAMS